MRDPLHEAALALARRALEWIGYFDGSYDPDDKILDGDADLAEHALAVYDAAGEQRPIIGTRKDPHHG